MPRQETDLTVKLKAFCDHMKAKRDIFTGTITLTDNLKETVNQFELGVDAMIKTIKVFYSYHKSRLTPRIKGFYPNCEVLEREYHYQNRILNKKYAKK